MVRRSAARRRSRQPPGPVITMTPTTPKPLDARALRQDIADLVRANIDYMVSRWEAKGRPEWLDTKVDIATGTDFATSDRCGTVHGPDVVYGWIQGRGLEALAGHRRWLGEGADRTAASRDLEPRLDDCLRRLGNALERRRAEHGRLFFMMRADTGAPLCLDDDGRLAALPPGDLPPGFTDLFYSKGLAAAGSVLGEASWVQAGSGLFGDTVQAIMAGRFVSDQQPMDARNPVRPVPGRLSHGPAMIAIGGTGTLLQITRDAAWWDAGLALARYIVARHISHGQFDGLQDGDLVEFITPDGAPYDSAGAILCDPGHALEWVGLTARLLWIGEAVIGRTAAVVAARRELQAALLGVFRQAFRIGFNPEAGGICKLVDLRTRRVVNGDMPWWSLPETLRAAALLRRLYPDHATAAEAALGPCWCALERYLSPAAGRLAVQTRDAAGRTVAVIPACPDADPCYHTGLSLIDTWRALDR